eukprot:NODE_3826_length_726_cov_36.450517_g3226_i0.p1 GENE.NODE_3826_length_726_cov_36.450517_g3226_i0~~NODE_3826_length_726_cov_36.450517_g3226_i0.p1  ORF type:complete len:153 (+),score=28.69 NODE_3826_length_726_cov_36.450517_g3226_i0:198-656(+)
MEFNGDMLMRSCYSTAELHRTPTGAKNCMEGDAYLHNYQTLASLKDEYKMYKDGLSVVEKAKGLAGMGEDWINIKNEAAKTETMFLCSDAKCNTFPSKVTTEAKLCAVSGTVEIARDAALDTGFLEEASGAVFTNAVAGLLVTVAAVTSIMN